MQKKPGFFWEAWLSDSSPCTVPVPPAPSWGTDCPSPRQQSHLRCGDPPALPSGVRKLRGTFSSALCLGRCSLAPCEGRNVPPVVLAQGDVGTNPALEGCLADLPPFYSGQEACTSRASKIPQRKLFWRSDCFSSPASSPWTKKWDVLAQS